MSRFVPTRYRILSCALYANVLVVFGDNERRVPMAQNDSKEFNTPLEVAVDVLQRLNQLLFSWNDDTNRELAALDEEICGTLEGIVEGRITCGQPRLAELLHQLYSVLPPEPGLEIAEIIGDCARFGVTAVGQELTIPYKRAGFTSTIKR